MAIGTKGSHAEFRDSALAIYSSIFDKGQENVGPGVVGGSPIKPLLGCTAAWKPPYRIEHVVFDRTRLLVHRCGIQGWHWYLSMATWKMRIDVHDAMRFKVERAAAVGNDVVFVL